MANTSITSGVTRALVALVDVPDRTPMEGMSVGLLRQLAMVFARGVSAEDVSTALQLSRGQNPMDLISKENARTSLEGKRKTVYVVSYLNDPNVRMRYPVDDPSFKEVKSLMAASRNADAVRTLQSAIASKLSETGRTSIPVVEIGTQKTVDTDQQTTKSILDNLPANIKSRVMNVEESGGSFVCEVGGVTVSGKNKSRVGNVARYVLYCQSQRVSPELVKKMSSVAVSARVSPGTDAAIDSSAVGTAVQGGNVGSGTDKGDGGVKVGKTK